MLSQLMTRTALLAVIAVAVAGSVLAIAYVALRDSQADSRSDVVQTGEAPSVDWPRRIDCRSGPPCRIADSVDALRLRATYTFRGGTHRYRIFANVYLTPGEESGALVCFPPYQRALRCVPLAGSGFFEGETAVYA